MDLSYMAVMCVQRGRMNVLSTLLQNCGQRLEAAGQRRSEASLVAIREGVRRRIFSL